MFVGASWPQLNRLLWFCTWNKRLHLFVPHMRDALVFVDKDRHDGPHLVMEGVELLAPRGGQPKGLSCGSPVLHSTDRLLHYDPHTRELTVRRPRLLDVGGRCEEAIINT